MYLKNKRKLSYSLAINEALHQVMKKDRDVLLMGQGVKSPWYVGNTCKNLIETFGEQRIIDTPISENAMTGAAVGVALSGMKSIILHPRMDFMYYAFDPIINQAANWQYMFGGNASVPVVIWGIINRGGEQGAQHSQTIQAMFSHIPGLKVVMPSNAYDAKGLLISAIYDKNPVIYITDNWLYNLESVVPSNIYKIPIGKGNILKKGKDITIVAISYMVTQAIEAANELEKYNISVEVIDLRTVKPLDEKLLLNSVKKTGRLLIADTGWKTCGISAEISAIVSENILKYLKAPIQRIALPDIPAPANSILEKEYYPNKNNIIKAIKKILK